VAAAATERSAIVADRHRQLGTAFGMAAVVPHFNGEFGHGV
jgi:hypothetical protein